MSLTVRLQTPGAPSSRTVEVTPGETVLVGREPDPSGVLTLLVGGTARTVELVSPSVSANHVVIRNDSDSLTIIDADSRNGTWMRLPARDPVRVASGQEIVLTLAGLSPPSTRKEAPEDADWTDGQDFHSAVVSAVAAWFQRTGLPVRVTVTRPRRASDDGEHGGKVPLANGFELLVEPTRTVDDGWEEKLAILWRYVDAQNARFSSEEEARSEGTVLSSPAIRRAHRQVIEAAQRGVRLLLIGPSGSGKDGLARSYHHHSLRSGAFVSKNCSMFNRDLLRAELFGAEQGAFTSAVRRIVGAVESAHGGTLFLDEVGEMSGDVQPLLLTFLDRGEYERMGGYGQLRRADVRVVAATNRDLREATLKGQFREDLWYRLAGQVVTVPPLRERPHDIIAYLRLQRLGAGVDGYGALSAAARELVLAHAWRGNFRELAGFAARLPRNIEPESLGEQQCLAILGEISLASNPGPARPAKPELSLDLAQLAARAFDCFVEDYTHGIARWDDLKEYVERYFKPLVFAGMTTASALPDRNAAELSALAAAIDADRGTAGKQLARYFERFREHSGT